MSGENWGKALNRSDIEYWLKDAVMTEDKEAVGIIMAGNIPFVGLHDLLSVLATGRKALVKLSSTDEILMKYAIESLIKINTEYANYIEISERLNDAAKIIATGSNNSARYFDYYFRNKATLIRKNRTSMAVLTGKETKEELECLADDIYQYYGLGCRNVTHILMPRTMDLHLLYTSLDKYMDHVNHHKFYNNYIYHKSILLMNLTKHYDNGFMIFQEKDALNAPLGTLNYHYYDNADEVKKYIDDNREQIQCVASNDLSITEAIPLGTTQAPLLWQYADNINTLEFLNQSVASH